GARTNRGFGANADNYGNFRLSDIFNSKGSRAAKECFACCNLVNCLWLQSSLSTASRAVIRSSTTLPTQVSSQKCANNFRGSSTNCRRLPAVRFAGLTGGLFLEISLQSHGQRSTGLRRKFSPFIPEERRFQSSPMKGGGPAKPIRFDMDEISTTQGRFSINS